MKAYNAFGNTGGDEPTDESVLQKTDTPPNELQDEEGEDIPDVKIAIRTSDTILEPYRIHLFSLFSMITIG